MDPTQNLPAAPWNEALHDHVASLLSSWDPTRPVGDYINEVNKWYAQHSSGGELKKVIAELTEVAPSDLTGNEIDDEDQENESKKRGARSKPYGTFTIWRRHSDKCDRRSEGRSCIDCECPLWADGYTDGKRTLRKSLGTRDMARARAKLAILTSPDQLVYMGVGKAVKKFIAQANNDGRRPRTIETYKTTLGFLKRFCDKHGIEAVANITVETIDDFRDDRLLASSTSRLELKRLRKFFRFCCVRKWCADNPAKAIDLPPAGCPNEIVPYTASEIADMKEAARTFSRFDYDRLRAVAILLTLRYTALRISDVVLLRRDKIVQHGNGWKINLRTNKNQQPIFLPIPNAMKLALDAVPLPNGADQDCPYYFWTGNSKPKTVIGDAARAMRGVYLKSGVADAKNHRFRHTLATELLEQGASFEEVADILGDSVEVVRKHYAKWSKRRQERIFNLMSLVYSDDPDWSAGSNAK